MGLGGDYRRADELRTATARAPTKQRLRVEQLRRVATDRKLLLLDCAIVRHAPFGEDGRTIWELLPTFDWFSYGFFSTGAECTVHAAIEIVERLADNAATTEEVEEARFRLRHTEYAAEADRFGYDAERLPGSELRYGVAYWIMRLAEVGPQLRSIFDFYITAYQRRYYAWARTEPLHLHHQNVALTLIDDIFGNPFRPVAFDPAWRTDTAVSLARQMYEARDFSLMPILADALKDAGCENPDVLGHCRGDGPHVRGCWVVDLVLGKS